MYNRARLTTMKLTLGSVYNTLTIPWATSLLGFIAVAMVPIPWLLLAFGPKIRSWSRLAKAI